MTKKDNDSDKEKLKSMLLGKKSLSNADYKTPLLSKLLGSESPIHVALDKSLIPKMQEIGSLSTAAAFQEQLKTQLLVKESITAAADIQEQIRKHLLPLSNAAEIQEQIQKQLQFLSKVTAHQEEIQKQLRTIESISNAAFNKPLQLKMLEIGSLSDSSFKKSLLSKMLEVGSPPDDKKEIKNIEQVLHDNNEQIKNSELKSRMDAFLPHVKQSAQIKLRNNTSFAKNFDPDSTCSSVAMSIDIRNSTNLMLCAKSDKSFAEFITILIHCLINIVLSNYGFYDKFTGDGLLCYFPKFYSGKSSIYYALKTAKEAHSLFNEIYQASYSYFSNVPDDVGFGIGISYGDAYLTSINGSLTLIGHTVVSAVRLSSAPKVGQTYINQAALDELHSLHYPNITYKSQLAKFKTQGDMRAYDVSFDHEAISPEKPDWDK